MNIGSRLVPSDVREVIDRTDARMLSMIERLAVIADEMSESCASLRESNALLREQNTLLRAKLK